MVFDKIKRSITNAFSSQEETPPEYIEIDLGREVKKAKVIVRRFTPKSFEDINPILNALREGYTIALIDIDPLKKKDIIELKRAISKIRKTVEALEGSLSGFAESVVIATPGFAEIYNTPAPTNQSSSAGELVKE